MLRAIFYARFHPERGPSVIEAVPEGSVRTRRNVVGARERRGEGRDGGGAREEVKSTGQSGALVDFSEISAFVIPPYELCGRGLGVWVGDAGKNGRGRGGSERVKVLGWPVSLVSEGYARNRFTFNVCFVVSEHGGKKDEEEGSDSDDGESRRRGWRASVRSWDAVVKKTALFFQALELDDGILAAEEAKNEGVAGGAGDGSRGTVVKSLLDDIFAQLTLYGETCVRVDKIHTLNLRLARPRPLLEPPAEPGRKVKIRDWHVPLLTHPLPAAETWTPDLVLARIHPHVDGIAHVARIAERAQVDVKLVRRAVRGLVAMGRARTLDLFHFQAVYALTAEWAWFVRDEEMQEECRRYICTSHGDHTDDIAKQTPHILALYAAFGTPQSARDFALAQHALLAARHIDIRRFVTFAALKGFLRRVHKYALAVAAPTPAGSTGGGSGSAGKRSNEDAAREFERAWRRAALSSGWATPPAEVAGLGGEEGGSLGLGDEEVRASPLQEDGGAGGGEAGGGEVSPEEEKLRGFLDGKHCLDEICVAMQMSERNVLERLRSARGRALWGEVVVFCK